MDSEDQQNSSKSSKTTLVFYNRSAGMAKPKQNQLVQACRIIPIYKTPSIQTKYFLFGDTMISLDLSNQVQFEESLAIQNIHRPVISLKREFQTNFLRVNLDNSISGITDFQFLIPLLQSMQNVEMYNLSKTLLQYQEMVQEDLKQQSNQDSKNNIFKKGLMEEYQNTLIPELLKIENDLNPQAISLYMLWESKYSLMDTRLKEYGVNQNFMHLLGTNIETLQEFIMRVGWFETTWIQDSTEFICSVIQNYIESFQVNQGLGFFEEFSFRIITLDQLILPAKFLPKTYYLLDDPTLKYTTQLQPGHVDKVVGTFFAINIDIDVSNIKNLIELRQSSNTLQNNNLLFQLSENTLSQFQYETQSNYFYNKFYNNPSQSQPPRETRLQEVYPQLTCNYKPI